LNAANRISVIEVLKIRFLMLYYLKTQIFLFIINKVYRHDSWR